ncbi:hypothetical protein AB7783_07380 [Tardiphaga sp. 172_B4_N1_3]|uniref:hypothetical protein n=1 Tax=Tardiphaga sp. 172_B4_N1_3 TaxID=3240787 RepID=UPI003F8B4F76
MDAAPWLFYCPTSLYYLPMEKHLTKEELFRRRAIYRELAAEFPDGPTAKNIRELIEEIEQQLRNLPNDGLKSG